MGKEIFTILRWFFFIWAFCFCAVEDSANPGPIDNRQILTGVYRPLVKNAYQKIIFLFLNQNIWRCGYSKYTPQNN